MSGQSCPGTSKAEKKNCIADMQGREEGGEKRKRELERKDRRRKRGKEEGKNIKCKGHSVRT